MKLYHPMQVLLSILGIIFPAPMPAGERPASAPPIDERLTGIESRMKGHDTDILELQNQIEALRLAIRCPCGRGGKCVCPPDACLCPHCPEHHKGAKVAGKWKGMYPTFKGREVLYFTASWCPNCPAAEERLGSLKSQIYKIECDEKNPYYSDGNTIAKKYGVTAFPTAILLEDGVVQTRCVGEYVKASIVGDWLEKPSLDSSGGNASRGVNAPPATRPLVRTANAPARISIPRATVVRGNGPGHTHRCGRCGTSWSHENWNVGSYSAHLCPGCGSLNYGNRTEGWSAAYRTRSQPVSYQQNYRPRVVFASGGSYCPTCPR